MPKALPLGELDAKRPERVRMLTKSGEHNDTMKLG